MKKLIKELLIYIAIALNLLFGIGGTLSIIAFIAALFVTGHIFIGLSLLTITLITVVFIIKC